MKKLFLGVTLLSAFAFAKAQTVEEIATKHVEALGGKANIAKLQNVVMEGSMSAQGVTVNLTFTRVPGKLYRQDINVEAMGLKGYDLTTDKDGWTFMPFLGQTTPVEKTGDTLKAAQQQLGLFSDDGLYDYQAKGNKVELQGKEDINGTENFKIKVTDASGEVSTVYINPATYYITRVSTIKKINGMEMPMTVDLSDYKDVDGVKLPFSMGTPQGNVVFSSIKANQTIDEKVYKHN
jgi:hypothetical protein